MLPDCQINPGEKFEDFTTRFDNIYKSMQQAVTNLVIPDIVLAMQLVRAAKLDTVAGMNVRTRVDWERDDVYDKTVKAINKICYGQTGCGRAGSCGDANGTHDCAAGA